MTQTADQGRPRKTSPFAVRGRPELFWWHVGWLAAVGVGARLLLFPDAGATRLDVAALVVGAIPAIYGLVAMQARHDFDRALAIGVWSVGGAAAALLTGGVAGPLAAWCLAPIAAAAAIGGANLLAFGAAASVVAVGVCALAAPLLGLEPTKAVAAYWLGLLSLSTTAAGLGVGLVALQRNMVDSDRRRDASEARLRSLLADQPHLLVWMEAGRQVTGVYGHAPVGVTPSSLVDRALAQVAAPAARPAVEGALRRALAEGAAEVGFAPAGAPEAWLVASIRRTGPQQLVAAIRDAGAERAREAELLAAREEADAQNAGKSRFLANMSHELRTPLNAIMGFSDIMRTQLFGPLPEKYGEYAELIHESGSHLLELINDVLDMSKIEAERFELALEPFDARDAVSAVLRLMRGQADRAGVHLRGVLPREPIEVTADRRALKQIALNLISNALKFTPKDGSVTVALQPRGEVLELTVTDTGVGISPEDLQRIGRPYEQAGDFGQRAAGTGLGLSLVRAFSELHGGEMNIESTLGEGTSVAVRLPVIAPEAVEDRTGGGGPVGGVG
ncbi:MAG: sensor histidine kinase [Phenylobacterium sp.]|uniref:sensor histidine kinase n=1 Tax=Phenylobacterium sp. TaxID=1871053 RepID=UPI00391A865A